MASRPGDFTARVLAMARMIPRGCVATYGDVARWAGHPRAARAVGAIMAGGGADGVPYHRVIAAGGRLGGYGGHERLKAHLLQLEGHTVIAAKVRAFARVRWTGPGGRTQRRRTC